MDKRERESLMRCGLFLGLTAGETAGLLSDVSCRTLSLRRNQFVALAGADCNYASIVVQGELHVYMTGSSGKAVMVSRRGVGDMLAPAFIYGSVRTIPVSIRAAVPSRVLRIAAEDLTRLMERDPRLSRNFIRVLSDTVAFLSQKIFMLSLQTVREKIKTYVLRLAREQAGSEVTIGMSRQELADMFGIQKYSLTRCLSELSREGVIKVEGRRITILDGERLAKIN